MKQIHDVKVFDNEWYNKVMIEDCGEVISITEFIPEEDEEAADNEKLIKEGGLLISKKDVPVLLHILKKFIAKK